MLDSLIFCIPPKNSLLEKPPSFAGRELFLPTLISICILFLSQLPLPLSAALITPDCFSAAVGRKKEPLHFFLERKEINWQINGLPAEIGAKQHVLQCGARSSVVSREHWERVKLERKMEGHWRRLRRGVICGLVEKRCWGTSLKKRGLAGCQSGSGERQCESEWWGLELELWW